MVRICGNHLSCLQLSLLSYGLEDRDVMFFLLLCRKPAQGGFLQPPFSPPPAGTSLGMAVTSGLRDFFPNGQPGHPEKLI